MDTEINYKYKDGFHSDIKSGHLTIDKEFAKTYMGRRDDTPLSDRLNHWGLICNKGDEFIQFVLLDLIDFFELRNKLVEHMNEDEQKLLELYYFLSKQELVELTFEIY